jgi:chromosome segregation protein
MPDKGAHFYRCDLQAHTPRDRNWAGNDAVTDDERMAYARSLIQACRDKGLQGIAVTDHHDMLFVPFVRRAAAEETDAAGNPLPKERHLVVFPGMELTLGVPCQALLLFDAEFPNDLFALAMTALTLTPSAPTEAKTAETKRLDKLDSLKQLKEQLDQHAYLRDRYIVLPNVTNEGQFSIFRTGFAGKYIEMPCVGGYCDGDIANLTPGIKNRIAGKDKNWGNKRIACFQTSDNRRADHANLGTHSTWIKWATPTAEALRQACLAQESRVSHEAPRLPLTVVGSISISNSSFLGPIDLELNPQYNTLIGGRGTGKSTILEYLRWALCDQPPGLADEDTPNYQARRTRLIDQTLKPLGATAQVRFEVNGVPHLVRRNSQDGSLLIKVGNDQLRPCTEDEVRGLLPIQAYSQKQLSDVSIRVEELGRFITSPIRSDLGRIDRQLADRAGRVRQAHATRLRYRELTRTLQKRELEEKSLTEQANALRASLTGLSDEDRTILDRGKIFETADQFVQAWQDGIASLGAGATSLLQTVDSHLSALQAPPSEPEGDVLTAAHAEYETFLNESKTALDAIVEKAAALSRESAAMDLNSSWRRWADRIATVRSAYETAVKKSSAYSEKLKQLKDIEDQLAKHGRETARVREELQSLAAAESAYQTERTGWLDSLKERDDLLTAQCKALTASSGEAIRAEVRRHGDVTDFVGVLRQALSGSRVQGGKIDALGESIANAADPRAQWAAVLGDLERLAEYDGERDGVDKRPDAPALSAVGFTAGEQDRLAKAFQPNQWLSLSLTRIIHQ